MPKRDLPDVYLDVVVNIAPVSRGGGVLSLPTAILPFLEIALPVGSVFSHVVPSPL